MQLSLLWSDYLIYFLVLILVFLAIVNRNNPHWRGPWRQVLISPLGAMSVVILGFYVIIGLLDSIHLDEARSVLDIWMSPLDSRNEQTYSAPFANHLFVYGHASLKYTHGNMADIFQRLVWAVLVGGTSFLVIFLATSLSICLFRKRSLLITLKNICTGKTLIAWRTISLTFLFMWILVWGCVLLATHYHILGTDKIGRDVFYLSVKSIRTGLIIGTITTLFTLPFALFLGTIAGYFRGIVDDVIQYLYTTLSSIPGVLLISAAVLMLQVYMAKNASNYTSLAIRADVRLLALCFILAITGWASLCRFLRAETLKLRELEFVQAAQALGVKPLAIIMRHIVPNVFHIVIITLVLDFSVLVLAEAVLSYVGVGVDPTTMSWGNMINSSRLELAREPMVWWPLISALISMFGLVLSANIFADIVRDAFDPNLRINISQEQV